jgi:molybdopterin-guanine dinucleotide biosynthesis protein A
VTFLGKKARTLIVLSGGESRRFGGKDKGLQEYDGIPLAKRVVDSLRHTVDSAVVQVAEGKAEEYRRVIGPTINVQEDSTPFKGPLYGLSEALRSIDSEIVLLSPCDLPNVSPRLYALLVSRMGDRDAAVPHIGGYLEPISAVYRTEKLRKAVEMELNAGRFKLSGILDHLNVVFITERELKESGIDVDSLRSLNTPS